MNRDRQGMPEAVPLRQGNKPFQSERKQAISIGNKQAVLIERNKPFRWEEIREINSYPVISA
jgi:hypothetical protein